MTYLTHYPRAWDPPADWREAQRRWDRMDPRATSPYTDPPTNPPTTTREPTMTDLDNVTLAGTPIPTPPPAEVARSRAAYLAQSPTTTPSFPNQTPTGAVPTLRPNPGMLRALLQPILFFTLTEPVDAYEVGDTVALQFWGEGRVMVTPLPMAASRGRIPTTFPANKIHGYIAVPLPERHQS